MLGVTLIDALYVPTGRTLGLEGFAVKVNVIGEVELAEPDSGETVSHGLLESRATLNPTALPVLVRVTCWVAAGCPAKGAVKINELLLALSNGLLLTTRLTVMGWTTVPDAGVAATVINVV